MSNLVFVYDAQFHKHLTPETHPESPHRLAAIQRVLRKSALFENLSQVPPRPATGDELSSVHHAAYIEQLERSSQVAIAEDRLFQLDADTFMSAESYETARLAAGAGLVAVESLVRTNHGSSFVAIRPPGHHARSNRAMGFCLFNNIAVAARYAQEKLNVERILIVDWDVHHGNGTQEMFYSDPSVCFISFHQYPLWPPDSGWYTEDGAGEGKGFNINIPLPEGSGDRGYLRAWDQIVTPIAAEYEPNLILVSAGYDAHRFDPLAQQEISTSGYYLLSERLAQLAESAGAKVACFLEGGYNTEVLAEAAVTTMSALNARSADERRSLKPFGTKYGGDIKEQTGDRSEQLVDERIDSVRRHFSKYWTSLRGRCASA